MTRQLTPLGRLLIMGLIVGIVLFAIWAIIPTAFGGEMLPLVPNDTLTPGVVASTDQNEVCAVGPNGTYSQQHRQTTSAMKAEVYRAYGIAKAGRSFEVDHRLPLALGGKDDVKNLWPQAGFTHPSFHDKDKLEDFLWEAVCKHHAISLAKAQAYLLGNWIMAYTEVFGRAP